ncbi:MAG: hypothetical protein VYD64_01190 [Pseudomonadota bacterium]|nr:hypothetical protein [Pseudomonadota bacterium]
MSGVSDGHANEEFFGDDSQIAVSRRGAALSTLLADNPRFSYYGRLVTLGEPGEDSAVILTSLARLQGAGVSYYFPKKDADAIAAQLVSLGFTTDRHEHYRGGEEAYKASLAVLAETELPGDLAVVRIGPETSAGLVRQTAELCIACGVQPIPGKVMRGMGPRGINLVAVDSKGRPVANGASLYTMHPGSRRATDVFWGMLATREDRRGERIALILGAMAIRHMWEEEGARGFCTGVRHDNLSSQKLCNRLGVTDTEWCHLACIDKRVLGRESFTR